MAIVRLTPDAREQFAALPKSIRPRVARIIQHLRSWPNVSGIKRLSGNLAGHYRARTGDYRVQFRVKSGRPAQGDHVAEPDIITVEKIGHRDRFYDDA
jgi:mRNA-degrading endonuclease RelE of RelBE toxin-antitoxin system